MSNPLKNLIAPLVSPPVYDFWVSQIRSNASWNTPLATVVERHVEARNCVTLVLRPNRNFRGFTPGQHVNVTVEVDGVRYTRCYSFTGIPNKKRRISLTIKQIEGGKVSTQLCQNTQVGDVLELSDAFGEMVIAPDNAAPKLLIAAGSGITPLISLLRSLTQQPLQHPITLLYWARTRADLCFYHELKQLAATDPLFQFHCVLTREPDLLTDDRQGRPSADIFESTAPNIKHHEAYVCGPADFVTSVRHLISSQVASFSSEAFSAPSIALQSVGTVRVQLQKSKKTLELPTDKTLLEALQDAGMQPDYGCRMGICNTCACSKASGASKDITTGNITESPQSALRLCINVAQSDLILDL